VGRAQQVPQAPPVWADTPCGGSPVRASPAARSPFVLVGKGADGRVSRTAERGGARGQPRRGRGRMLQSSGFIVVNLLGYALRQRNALTEHRSGRLRALRPA
jgi:hypothetical protein